MVYVKMFVPMIRLLRIFIILIAVILSHAAEWAGADIHDASIKQSSNLRTDNDTAIQADELEYDVKIKTYFLKGNVLIIKNKATLKADTVEYSEITSLAQASGNVYYDDEDVTINADHAVLYIDNKTGKLHNAALLFKKDNYRIKSKNVIKQADNEYYAEEATITTCDAPTAAWCINASKANIKTDDSISAKNIVFKIKGLSTLYSPFFYNSLKRKTGFLLPSFGFTGDKGAYLNVPFYWAIADNRDLTLIINDYTQRGLGESIEYRYLEKNGMQGKLWLYHQYDSELDKNFLEVKGRHEQKLNNGLSSNININYINEKDFYKEYSPDIEKSIERFLESSAEIAYSPSSNKWRTYLLGQYWVDLEFDNDLTSQKLPEGGFILHPIDGLLIDKVSLASSFANFVSQDGIKGQRFNLSPKLYHTFGKELRFNQTAGALVSYYNLSGSEIDSKELDSHIENTAFEYKGALQTSFYKKYSTFTHIIEPEISYTYISDSNDAPIFDSAEIFDKRNQLELSLMNYFRNQRGNFFYLRLSNPYDIAESKHDKPFGPFTIQAALIKPIRIKAEAAYNYNSNSISAANSELSLTLLGADISLGNRYNKEDDIFFLTSGVGINLTQSVRLNTAAWYDTKEQGLRNLALDLIYNQQCWGISLLYRKTVEDYGLYFLVELKGLGKYTFHGL
ncbi:organic solvent tolerance protein OstA [Candidatus Magnetoovum chiemensis]|nr:organic solvent tolerance protein OstA [Candidatus Magnetoovum chiemensis]